jgi:hypothetical protein
MSGKQLQNPERRSGMNRYGRDYDRGMRGGQGYDRGYASSGNRRDEAPRSRGGGFPRDRAVPWYAHPDRSMTEGFGDFSGRGRYGGFWGATDLRPMMAGRDVEMRRRVRRTRYDR